jgi:hypothetical protein
MNKEQPSPTKRVEQLKLYPAGGSRDYQYKQLCEQLATELEAVQKESMELLAENAELKSVIVLVYVGLAQIKKNNQGGYVGDGKTLAELRTAIDAAIKQQEGK